MMPMRAASIAGCAASQCRPCARSVTLSSRFATIVAFGVGAAVAGAAAHVRHQHGEARVQQHLNVGAEIRPRLR